MSDPPDVVFNIARIAINDFAAAYDPLIGALRGSLEDLGYRCAVSTNFYQGGAVNIIVGSTIFASGMAAIKRLVGHPYLVVQLEQLDERHGLLPLHPDYRVLLRDASGVLDYSPAGTSFLTRHLGLSRARHLPPGFHRSLERFRPAERQDIDVLFYGSPHPRRAAMLARLRAEGLEVVGLEQSFGDDLIGAIRRARIVLNLHSDEHLPYLETVRLSYLLANRCFVVSEAADHNPYADGVIYAGYDDLAATCAAWLMVPRAERDRVATRGYMAIREIDMMGDLRTILAAFDLHSLVSPT